MTFGEERGFCTRAMNYVTPFLRYLSDVENSARMMKLELSLICGDFQ